MLIYRVETKDGVGMYKSHTPLPWNGQKDIPFYKFHPCPQDDEKLRDVWIKMDFPEYRQWYFGFASIEQLKFWIFKSEWRVALKEQGLIVSIYDTDNYHIGDTQAIFIRETSVKKGELSLTEI